MFTRTLIIETSGKIGQVALASGDHVVAEARLDQAQRRASDLALVVERLLKSQGWRARELTDVVVGLGPGSYTGLRVGLASAKAVAYATSCRFFGVETYAAIALRAPDSGQSIAVIGDALRGKLFRHDFHRGPNGLEPAGELAIVPAAEWLAQLAAGAYVTGPAASQFEGRLLNNPIAAVDVREPRPIDLWRVAATLPWATTTDVWRAEPYYVRGSSAEEKAAGRT